MVTHKTDRPNASTITRVIGRQKKYRLARGAVRGRLQLHAGRGARLFLTVVLGEFHALFLGIALHCVIFFWLTDPRFFSLTDPRRKWVMIL
jgi:hypothetical protein